ncbi:hypothetical protein [Pseudomonas peli]|uniref:hypothetical protein n=1 Tax=Pseudomonas peli TaxID=592361 RepID=UPI0024AE35C0|nr:hypothetical protein [Pseudomonas peli]
MPTFANMNHTDAMNHAQGLISELRQTLDLIQAGTDRNDLAAAVQLAKGPMAALLDELEDSIAQHAGRNLTGLAEDLEQAHGFCSTADAPIFSIGELRHQARQNEPRAFDRDCRVLHQAWDASCLPDQFQSHLEHMGLTTSFGQQVARVLGKYFDEAKACAA